MNSKTIFHLLLVFSLFASGLPASKHFLVETEDKQVGGPLKILQKHENTSKYFKILQNTSKYFKILQKHENTSKYFKILHNTSKT